MGPSRSQNTAVVVMVMLALLLASPPVASWRIDCTRFVFAPRCRGVAAKRGDDSLSTKQSALMGDGNAQPLQRAGAGVQNRDPDTFLQLLMALAPAMSRSAPLSQRRKERLDDFLSS
nr:elevenin M1 [Conus magus]